MGVGLWIIGVPSAPLWGMLAMIFRFVPYIGPLISAIFPLILAAAAGTGWAMVLWTAVLFAIAETVAGQIIEPLAYGHSSGLSPIAVITSATFWTWLWGPVGLILATPHDRLPGGAWPACGPAGVLDRDTWRPTGAHAG